MEAGRSVSDAKGRRRPEQQGEEVKGGVKYTSVQYCTVLCFTVEEWSGMEWNGVE